MVGALIFRQERHILSVQDNAALVYIEHARNSVEQRGFARAVSADDGDEISGGQCEGKILHSLFFIDRARAEGLERRNQLHVFCVDGHRDGRRHDDAVYHSAHSCRQHAFCQRVGPAAAEQHLADDQAGQPDDYHARTQRIVSKFLILGDERA